MLERFHVPEDEAVRVMPDRMRDATNTVFSAMGLSDSDAELSTDVLMYADLNGVDTHGVSNMLRMYVQGYQAGNINPNPEMRIIRESNVTAAFDGDGGLGLHQAPRVMDIVIEKAKEHGMAAATLMNSGHLGAAGYHAVRAIDHDMIGVCMTGGGGFAMLPTFGAEPRFGTNPLAWAVPARNQPYFIFDAATTQVAGNKIRLLQRMNAPILPGWLARDDGSPIMEEEEVPEEDIRGERRHWYMLPFGGTREMGSHKGYALACIVDIMTSTLSGNGPGFVTESGGHFFSAYRIDAFTDPDKFKDDMDLFLDGLATTPPAPGHDRVVYPGLIESEERMDRTENGIPYHPEVMEWFDSINAELELNLQLP